ncbi:hypothetical protein ASF36_23540 [Methylobacterium sp. Leaf90]|nr:hypothetical protein ASF36_23540 [Methylobacterium sp. Leaf90]
MNAFVEQFEEAFVHRNEGSDTEVATDALLRSMVESERVGLTFSAVRDGGVLTTWQVADLTGDSYWRELLRLGERIHAVGGLDALDEANMYIVHMDLQHSDWRAMVLESVWFNIGRE